MSRWQTEFEQHPFQSQWQALLAEIPTLTVDDATVLTAVQELARFKKVIEYLRSVINSIDSELVPKTVWDSFQGQCTPCLQQLQAYKSSRNLGQLQAANQHLDNLLTYVRPYQVLPVEAINALVSAASSYRSQLEEYVQSFLDKTRLSVEEIARQGGESKKLLKQLQNDKGRIDALVVELIDGTSEHPSIQSSLQALKQTFDQQATEIEALYKRLLVDSSESKSISSQVEVANSGIIGAHKRIQEVLNEVAEQLKELGTFYVKIFGSQNEDGKRIGGLEQELDARTQQLTKLEGEQRQKYEALLQKIESLLPGATSAGLARAYQELRKSFTLPIKRNTQLFYAAVGLMPVVALITSIESVRFAPFALTLMSHGDFEAILKAMLIKIPFVAPLIWLAIFASARRSQYERLRQEYAHKEALAKSYESYKKQLEALLATDAEPLQKELISKAIEAIAFNASATLDGRHQDKLPIEQALEIIAGEKGLTFLERLRKLIP